MGTFLAMLWSLLNCWTLQVLPVDMSTKLFDPRKTTLVWESNYVRGSSLDASTSDVGIKFSSKIWALDINLDTTQIPSSEMEGESHLLRMIWSLTVVAGKSCAAVSITSWVGGLSVTPVAAATPEEGLTIYSVEEVWMLHAEITENKTLLARHRRLATRI